MTTTENDNVPVTTTSSSVVEAMTAGDLRACLQAAKFQLRQPERAAEAILNATKARPGEASSYYYALRRRNRDGSIAYIYGPSVRMAELVAYHWGNLRIQTRTVEVDTSSDNPHVTVMALAHDMERNVYAGVETTRRILVKTDQDGRKVLSPDMVQLAQAACESIAFREAVFRVVPRFVYQQAYEECLKLGRTTEISGVQAQPLAGHRATVEKMLNTFRSEFGIAEPQILALLSLKTADQITPQHVVTLRGYYNGLKNGEVTVDELLAQTETPTPQPEPAPQETRVAEAPGDQAAPQPAKRPGRRRATATATPATSAATPQSRESDNVDALMQAYSQVISTALAVAGAQPDDITDFIRNAIAPSAGLSEEEINNALTDPSSRLMEAVVKAGEAPLVQWARENARLRRIRGNAAGDQTETDNSEA